MMKHFVKVKTTAITIAILWLMIFSIDAHAAIDNYGLLDNVLSRYSAAATSWAKVVMARATWLFWTLALISMVWTFGIMALRKADIAEFYAEFVRFTLFIGFFWWLLYNGPTMAIDIMDSLRTIGGNASGTGSGLTPSGIVDIGFDIFFKVLDQSSLWSPIDSAVGIIMSGIILIILALISINMLLLMVSGWILAYAGMFFLGFGGSRWTSDIAISYYKTVLNVAVQLFVMVLLVGIGKSFVDQYYNSMSVGINLKELGVMMIVAVVLLALVNKVPLLIGQIAMGGGTQALGGGFGTGAALGAASMTSAALATSGAVFTSGVANAGGGAQALMVAYAKAAQNEANGIDVMTRGITGGKPNFGDSQEQQSSGMASSVMKGGKIAADMGVNLAKGAWEASGAKERMNQSFGGQMASAIKNQETSKPVFDDNSLAADDDFDPKAEVAAFVNSKPS